jgi:hypothetical protein
VGEVHDVHVSVPRALAADAMREARLPASTSVQALIRLALARMAGWPESAAATIARTHATGGKG